MNGQQVDLVKNAADARQVKHAARKERDRREIELADMRSVLANAEGRRFLWRLMGWSGMHENPTHQRGDMTHQNIGRADVGRFILSEIMQADEKKYLLMQQEAWQQQRADNAAANAVRTQSSTDEGTQ